MDTEMMLDGADLRGSAYMKTGLRRKNIFKKCFLYTLGIVLAIFYVFPIYILLLNSFKTQRALFLDVLGLPNSTSFTFKNYLEAFERLKYFKSFFNSLYITIFSVILILLVSSMAAWVLVRHKTKISKLIFIVFSVSMLVPFQCVMIPLNSVAKKLHLLNPFGLIFMYIGFGVSLSVLMIHGFIKNIPEELEESAIIDGCNVFQLFFVIVVPLLRVILITVAVLNIMWIWNDFLLPFLIIGGKQNYLTLPLKTYNFFSEYAKRWDLASAGLIMCMVPVILFYTWTQKYIIKGITDGAIK